MLLLREFDYRPPIAASPQLLLHPSLISVTEVGWRWVGETHLVPTYERSGLGLVSAAPQLF